MQTMNAGIRIEWTEQLKPNVNQWYREKDGDDFLKITKDFRSPEEKVTYYKIVSYYDCDVRFRGISLAHARSIMRELTYRKAV